MHTNFMSISVTDSFDRSKLERWLKDKGLSGPHVDEWEGGDWYLDLGKQIGFQVWVYQNQEDPFVPNITIIIQAFPQRDWDGTDTKVVLSKLAEVAQSLLDLLN